MSRVTPLLLTLMLGCAGVSSPQPSSGGPTKLARPEDALAVMTFNIRYGTAPDGPDAWPARQQLALQVIRAFDPAVLGVQEALRFQLDAIGRALPQLGEIGVGRDDGQQGGEYAAILYDRRRLAVLEQGRFWLSDTPEVPGSMTWGNRFPRIVTWARFSDRRPAATTFYVFNTHWDHESALARERSAAMLLQRIGGRSAPADPVLLLGDFNAGQTDPAFQRLLGTSLFETFRAAHPSAVNQIGTYHAFHGDRDGAKIDAVLASPQWRVLDAEIVTTHAGARYPSDHFPVTATLTLSR